MPPKPAAKPASKPAAKSTTAGAAAKKTTGAKTPSKPTAKGTSKPPAKAAEKKEAAPPPPPAPIVWTEFGVKQLDSKVVNDTDGTLKASGKWATVVDENGIPARFLRHRDVNMLSVPNPGDMEPETIRKALIGAIKFGKPFILDMMESEMYEYCRDQFDKVLPGLLDMVLDKSLVDDTTYKYMAIVKEDVDGPDFKNQYDYKMLNFSCIVLSQVPPNEELLRKTFPMKIV